MHIAICMDTAADRKQLERLLGRSTDKRLAQDDSVPFYIQSYGNKSALLARPFMYDLFFIDVLYDDMTSVELVRKLRELGVTATICLLPSKVDYTNEIVEDDNVLILRQPVIVDELEKIMDFAVGEVKAKVPTISIRTTTDTIHIIEEEFRYAIKKKDGIMIYLSDGREIFSNELIENFGKRVMGFTNIYNLPDNLVAHIDVIKETGWSSVRLEDGKKYRVDRKWLKCMTHMSQKNLKADE